MLWRHFKYMLDLLSVRERSLLVFVVAVIGVYLIAFAVVFGSFVLLARQRAPSIRARFQSIERKVLRPCSPPMALGVGRPAGTDARGSIATGIWRHLIYPGEPASGARDPSDTVNHTQ